MSPYKTLEKFTLGVGDRFGRQAKAQLRACELIAEDGVQLAPVWNKSNREHTLIGSRPAEVLAAAKQAVEERGWRGGWHVDADHIGLQTVDAFIPHSDFFTLDVAESIGQAASQEAIAAFIDRHDELVGELTIPRLAEPYQTTRSDIERIAQKYLQAVQDAGRVYRHISNKKGAENFVTEVSMDETDAPQTPLELLVILAAVADEGVPIQTIAPKFTGRFNKGVDYVGDLDQFQREFNDDLAVIAHATRRYDLPRELKLSVHSGSDKFSLYPIIRQAIREHNAGLHIKTAGTTWLEELIGLAESGGDALDCAKQVYAEAFAQQDTLTAPYATVIDVDALQLPSPDVVASWSSEDYVSALRHDQRNPSYNPSLRQLLHVSFKLAAKMGSDYLCLLRDNEAVVGKNVTENLYVRHLCPLFVDQ